VGTFIAEQNNHEPGLQMPRFTKSRTYPSERHNDCELCAILMPAYQHGEDAELSALEFAVNSHWHSQLVEDASRSVLLKMIGSEKGLDLNLGAALSSHIFYLSLECLPGFLKPQILRDIPDYEGALLWLCNCRNCHELDSNRLTPPEIDGLHLFDCHTFRVVRGDSVINLRYISLSYVWGDRRLTEPVEVSDCHRLTNMPRTIIGAPIAAIARFMCRASRC
jgi:hypothetical protein